jgi:hypothetical protein
VSTAWIRSVATTIERAGPQFGQAELEQLLTLMFTPENLAAMVTSRYRSTHTQFWRQNQKADAIDAR